MFCFLKGVQNEQRFVRHVTCRMFSSREIPTKNTVEVSKAVKYQKDMRENLTSKEIGAVYNTTISRQITDLSITTSSNKLDIDSKQSQSWNPIPCLNGKIIVNYYKKLSKFRLTSLVVITTMGGYAMAPLPFEFSTFLMCSLGTGLISAAANAVNQYHEVPFDSQMSRTKNRVLVTGQLTPLHAIGFAGISACTGISMLYFGVNGLTAALGIGNLLLYTSIYTPLKRMSIVNTWVGSIVGAIPPLMGWAGCAGHLEPGAWILAGVLFAWQFPHFNALSWNLRPDYSRAGYRMMAVTNPELCRKTALKYTYVIGCLSLVTPFMDLTNIWFALESFPLNACFCYLAHKFHQNSDSRNSRNLFHFSLLHLPALMLLFLLNKKKLLLSENSSTNPNEMTPENIPQNYKIIERSADAFSLLLQFAMFKKAIPKTINAETQSSTTEVLRVPNNCV